MTDSDILKNQFRIPFTKNSYEQIGYKKTLAGSKSLICKAEARRDGPVAATDYYSSVEDTDREFTTVFTVAPASLFNAVIYGFLTFFNPFFMDEYLGIVKLFAGPYAPQNWAFCNGALLNISQNTALFSILGTTYGGDGMTNFALPNLMGRVAVGAGNGTGIPNVTPGQVDGSATVTLQTANMPAHTHSQQFANVASTTNSPSGNVLAQITAADGEGIALTASGYAPAGTLVPGDPQAISPAGGSQPFSAIPPYLGMNYIICVNGLFPPRS